MEGEVQMINFIKREFGIKVFSAFFAILLWLFVLNNISNPFEEKTLEVGIVVQNQASLEDKNIGINKPIVQGYVQVLVKGRKDKAANVSASDIEAVVDLSQIKDAGTKELPIRVSSKLEGVDVSLVKQKTFSIVVENIIEKSIPVMVSQTGKMKENYKVTKITTNPDNVTVRGVESMVNQAKVARTTVDVSNINKTITLKKDYKVYGSNDEELMELGKNGSVEATVEVAKEVSVTPTIKGKPSSDYTVTGYTLSKDRVLITGFPEQLESIDELSTETVNIENISKNSDIISFIRVPEGIKLVDTQKDITVSITVEQLKTREFQVGRTSVLLQNTDTANFNYEVVPETFKFTIKGRDKDIKSLEAANFKVSVDLTGIGEGSTNLPVKIILPSNDINRIDDNNIEIKVTKKQ